MQRNSPAIKTILSPAMRRHMRAIPAQTHFLLLLRPGIASVDFLAVADNDQAELTSIESVRQAMDQAFRHKREEIVARGPEFLSTLSNSKELFRLCYEIVTEAQQLAQELKLTEQYIRAVAVNWLEEESLPLGNAPKPDDPAMDPWRTTPANHAQLRFQDALDWYAMFDGSLTPAQYATNGSRFEGYTGVGKGYNIVLKVPTPARRDHIVSLSNLKLFVAEHLLAYNKNSAALHEQDEDPELTFFFLPLKGLGQVRAAIDWVGVDTRGLTDVIHRLLNEEATNLQRSGLESLFTQSLIRSFGLTLRHALREARRNDQSNLSLHRAFADLWWAREVGFYRKGQFQVRLMRSEERDATTWTSLFEAPTLPQLEWTEHESIYSGFVAITGEPHPGLTYIRLSLASLFEEHSDQSSIIDEHLAEAGLTREDLARTYQSLPFDEVIFSCHFFRSNASDLAEWADQLAETVVSALSEQTIQNMRIQRSKAEALEGVAHWLNSLVRMAGRARAAKNLEGIIRGLRPDDPLLKGLEQIFDSLQLLLLLEAGTGSLRLLGTLDEGDFEEKLGKWFTSSSLAEWDRSSAFATYKKSLTHLVRAIGSSFGHPSVLVSSEGEEKLYTDYCPLDLDELLFPPLSKAEKGNEPILALLPALTEPVSNALTYLKSKGLLGSKYPLWLVIEDHRRDELHSIQVKIGSPYFEGDHLPSSHGLAIAREVSALTDLAEIGEAEVILIGGSAYYFVPVLIHPQRLAQRFNKSYDHQTKKTQTAHN